MPMTRQRGLSVLSGNLRKRILLSVLLPLIGLSYFGTLITAAWVCSETYDWRRKSISKLLYPQNDPKFHTVASLGIALAGLMMIPFVGYIGRRSRGASTIGADIGASIFAAGALSLILAGLVVSHPSRGTSAFPRLHEMLARGCALALGTGMVVLWGSVLKEYLTSSSRTAERRRLLLSWSVLVLPAIFVAVLRLAAGARLGWSNPVYRAVGNPRIWQLGFWEWLGSAAVFLFLLSAALFLPEHPDK